MLFLNSGFFQNANVAPCISKISHAPKKKKKKKPNIITNWSEPLSSHEGIKQLLVIEQKIPLN